MLSSHGFKGKYITVYQHHLEFGIHFPLHPFIHSILYEYNIFFYQFTPQSLRGIIWLVWYCEFFGFPLTLNVFRSCFGLRIPISSSGWCTFYNVNGTYCSIPKSNDLKDWKGTYYFVRVPTSIRHPHQWFAPTRVTQPLMISTFTKGELSQRLTT